MRLTVFLHFNGTACHISSARNIVETVARRFHPETRSAWARFSLPEFLLLTERLSRDVRREGPKISQYRRREALFS
jgi:hypothetical protein